MLEAVVTGSNGFIGTRLVSRLRATGTQVLAISRQDGDISENSTWEKIPPARVLFHLAGQSFIPDSWSNSAAFMQTNIIGTEQALSYCRRSGAGMVLASAYVYGAPKHLPISEQDLPKPNNPYALSKLMAEELAAFCSLNHQVPITVLRIFNVFGRGQRNTFLIPEIISQLNNGNSIHVQNLIPKRDYVHVEDVVDAFILAARALSGFKRFNIGSGTSISVEEIINTIQRVADTKLLIVSANALRHNEIMDVRADISAAKTVLGWTPRLTFVDGIREVMLGYEGSK